MSGTLDVDTVELHSAGTTFVQAASSLGTLDAQAPLNDAAAAVHALHTAGACRAAATEIAAEVAAVAGNARRFGGNLEAAARAYETRDQTAASGIGDIDIPN